MGNSLVDSRSRRAQSAVQRGTLTSPKLRSKSSQSVNTAPFKGVNATLTTPPTSFIGNSILKNSNTKKFGNTVTSEDMKLFNSEPRKQSTNEERDRAYGRAIFGSLVDSEDSE